MRAVMLLATLPAVTPAGVCERILKGSPVAEVWGSAPDATNLRSQ